MVPYQRIASAIRDRIFNGELAPGSKLPSRRELVEQYGCALETVARAMELLRHEGFITTTQGVGSFVREQPLIHRYGSTRLLRDLRPAGTRPFQHEAEREGQAASQQVTGVELLLPPSDIAAQLRADEDERVICRHHVLSARQIPVELVDTYYRHSLVKGHAPLETTAATVPGGAHAYIADVIGIALDHATERVTAREPTDDEATILQLRSGEPVICVQRTLYARTGEPVSVSDHRMAADKYRLFYDIPAS